VWNKQRNDEGYEPAPNPESGRSAPPAAPAAPRMETAPPARRPPAVIGASMNIKGEIRSREELMVDGEVEGHLESESLLTVGPNGKVRANIKAREVVIFGAVRGNVEVSEKIAIRERGSLVGDIKTAGISIDDGAYFKGSIDIQHSEPKAAAQPGESEETEISAGANG